MANQKGGTGRREIEVGDEFRFVAPYHRLQYGETATVTGIQVAESRPFGRRTTLVSAETANGTKIEWARGDFRRRTRFADEVPCGSGWTNDRCSKALGHSGRHSNE